MKELRKVIGWSVYILLLLVITFVLHTFCVERTVVSGDSMLPALMNNDQLIADKLSYRLRDPKRFEIIVFPHGNDFYVKRIIGLPGESVQISDGVIYINGEELQDPYGAQTIQNPGIAEEPFILPPGNYFVLGDNRNASIDSRMPDVGNISKSRIVGRCVLRVSPMERFGVVK